MPTIRIEVSGQSFDAPLPDQPVRIGSAEDADLRLQCGGVAAAHCVLEPLFDGRHKVADGQSGRPTLVNGIAVKQVSLKEGDVLQIGEAKITYSAAGAAAPPPPAAATPAPPAPARPAPARPAATRAAPFERAPAAPRLADSAPAAPRTTAPRTTAPEAGADSTAERAPAAPRAEAPLGEARPRTAAKAGSAKKTGLLVLVAVIAVVGVFIAAGGTSGPSGDQASLEHTYAEGLRLYDAKDYEGARAKWTPLADNLRAGRMRVKAADGLALLGDVEREMDARLQRLWAERLDLGASGIAMMRRSFLDTYGEPQEGRFEAMLARVTAAQATWRREQIQHIEEVTADFVASSRFADALEAWRVFAHSAPAAIDVSADHEAALKQLELDAETRAKEIIARADAWIAAETPYRSSKYLEDMLPRFKGVRAYAAMEAAHKRACIEAEKPITFTPTQPGPGTQPDPSPPEVPKPAVDESAAKALAARADKLVGEVAGALKARQFKAAAQGIEKGLVGFPAGDVKARLSGLVATYTLAESGLERLIAHINAQPNRYSGLKLTDRLTVSLIEADRETISAAVRGGRSKWYWERLAPKAFQQMVTRMRAERDDALAAAALLHVVGLQEQAERTLYRANQTGLSTDVIFPVLARWRTQPMPEGGYVVHEERFVTPAERTFMIREAAIAAALKLIDHRDPTERKKACEALLSIGEPAEARLKDALMRRRAFLADQLTSSKSFTSGKYKAKLLGLLDEYRAHALLLIRDAQAYPYPNPNKKNQKEVEIRVDRVREVWERPFDLVAQWDAKLKESLDTVTEVDEFLSRVDPSYTPDLDQIRARINKAINVPAAADPSKREYSLQVLAYNETLKTTAGGQEKDNVRVVNAYRMMMGLSAVKINERLTRAARGHSRHMQQNKYFAHDVPSTYATPQNRSPGARAKTQGFGGGVGENIARGPGTGRGAFNAWFGSSGHHRNMLGKNWLQMGCGRAGGSWWTQLFAGGSKSLKAPDPLPAPAAPFAPDPPKKNGGRGPRGPIEVPDEVPPGDEGDEPDEPDEPEDEP